MRIAVLALLLAAPLARAAAPDCTAPHDVDKYQLLRRLSLDLRGRVPSVDEYQALDGLPDVPAATIEAWLQTDDFRAAMRRYHESMFWPNVSKVRLGDVNNTLTVLPAPSTDPGQYIASAGRQKLYRGAADAGCGNYEQTHFDAAHPGEFRPDPAFVQTTTVNGATVRQEGWRLVSPYWAPQTQLKVCAYDAQESAAATLPNNQTASCATRQGEGAPGCGCGPGLKWCYGRGGVSTTPILAAMREQLDRAVDDVSTGKRPYTDLLLAQDSEQNGPLAFWKKNLAPHYALSQTFGVPDADEQILDKPFTDATFDKAQRGALHAGVLTLPGYLLRFQTDRGRANRFRIDFLCSYFVPPTSIETAAQGACVDNGADITQRCNCRYCHSVLEPMSAYFGLFSMAGTTKMTDPSLFPKNNPGCRSANPSAFCARFYVTQPDAHNAGALLPYQFADVHPEIVRNLEGGPRMLAQSAIDSGQLAQCTVRKLWYRLMSAEMYGASPRDESELAALADDFAASNYSLPHLVEQIVARPEYRRAR